MKNLHRSQSRMSISSLRKNKLIIELLDRVAQLRALGRHVTMCVLDGPVDLVARCLRLKSDLSACLAPGALPAVSMKNLGDAAHMLHFLAGRQLKDLFLAFSRDHVCSFRFWINSSTSACVTGFLITVTFGFGASVGGGPTSPPRTQATSSGWSRR